MSCDKCSEEQDMHTDGSGFYYRWKNADILLVGCCEHIGEFINFLNSKKEE